MTWTFRNVAQVQEPEQTTSVQERESPGFAAPVLGVVLLGVAMVVVRYHT